MSLDQEVCILYALLNGYLDDVELGKIRQFEEALHGHMRASHPDLLKQIAETKEITEDINSGLAKAIEEFKAGASY